MLSLVTALNAREAMRAMADIAERGRFSGLDFVSLAAGKYRNGENVTRLWTESVRESRLRSLLPGDAAGLLESFSEAFGKNSLGSFGGYCAAYSREFAKMYEAAERRREKNAGLVSALCLLSGAAAIIIFL